MLGAILVGNTTIRHALLEGETVLCRGFVTIPEDGGPLPAHWFPKGGTITSVVVGGVHPGRLEELLRGPDLQGLDVKVAGRDLPIPMANRYDDPSQVGIDRLLNALAASRLWPGEGVVVADFGTALSVSIVSPAGEFLGGPIAGGIRSLAEGLRSRTARLPWVVPDRPPERVGATSTREAMEAGIFWQVAAAAEKFLERLSAELPFPFHALATGGDGALFAPFIPRLERVDPDLALRGLAICHEHLQC